MAGSNDFDNQAPAGMTVDTDFGKDSVAEETAPDVTPPPAATIVFGPALDGARAFARMLATRGVERGLIGPHEVPRLWDRHLLNCAVVADLIDSRYRTLADIGSGAGLPGLVLALMRPELSVTLLEPMERRCRFLSECVAELGLANASVLRGRAEETVLRADVATARAVAPLDRLAEMAVRVVRPGGMVLAIKGRTAADELRKARPVLRRIGARGAEVVRAGEGKVDPATTVVRFFATRGRALGGAQLLPAGHGEPTGGGPERGPWNRPRLAGRPADRPDGQCPAARRDQARRPGLAREFRSHHVSAHHVRAECGPGIERRSGE